MIWLNATGDTEGTESGTLVSSMGGGEVELKVWGKSKRGTARTADRNDVAH